MSRNAYSRTAFQVGATALSLKLILIGAFGYFFYQPKDESGFHPNQIIDIAVDVVSVIGLISFILAIVGAVKKQKCWHLYAAFPISILATLAAPIAFTT